MADTQQKKKKEEACLPFKHGDTWKSDLLKYIFNPIDLSFIPVIFEGITFKYYFLQELERVAGVKDVTVTQTRSTASVTVNSTEEYTSLRFVCLYF